MVPRNRSPSERRDWSRFLRGPLGVIGFLTAAVYLVLMLRMLATVLFGSPASLLLSTALQEQIGRLNEIAVGPCDSTGILQFQRGEIGPIPPPEREVGQTILLPEPLTGASRQSGRILDGSELRQLVHRSVVRVMTDKGSGSGFAIAPNLVVTNRHVIDDGETGSIAVASKFLGASPVAAVLVASSPDSEVGNADFAVLRVQGEAGLFSLGLGGDPEPLDNVVAAGFPAISVRSDPDEINPDVVFSQGEVGVVQIQPNGVGLVIHTANIAPGSSGGPLLNRCGALVGVNTFVGTGEESEGRALYSLSSQALAAFLSSKGIGFESVVSGCAPGEGG